jgi:hypothetical protein
MSNATRARHRRLARAKAKGARSQPAGGPNRHARRHPNTGAVAVQLSALRRMFGRAYTTKADDQ